jgi:hypothetical protein
MTSNTNTPKLLHKAQPLDNNPLDEKSPELMYEGRSPIEGADHRQKVASLFSKITQEGKKIEDSAGKGKLYYTKSAFVITVPTKQIDSLGRTASIWSYGDFPPQPDSEDWISNVIVEMEFIANEKIKWDLVEQSSDSVKGLLRKALDEKGSEKIRQNVINVIIFIGIVGLALIALSAALYFQFLISSVLNKQAMPDEFVDSLIPRMASKDLALVVASGTVVYIAINRNKN